MLKMFGMDKPDYTTEFGRLLIAANAKYPHIKRPSHLAEHFDIKTQNLNNWRIRGIPYAMIDMICEDLNCRKEWLRTGEGEMTENIQNESDDETLLEIFGLERNDVSLELIELMHVLKKADKTQLTKLKAMAKDFLKSRKDIKGNS